MSAEPNLIAEMVLSQGNVQVQPLGQALDELADAVRDRQKNRPIGAVISRGDRPLMVQTVWRRLLAAVDQARSAFGAARFGDPIEIVEAKTLPGGIQVLSSSLESQARLGSVASRLHQFDLSARINSDWTDVLLVMSGEEIANSMQSPGAKALSSGRVADLRVLLLVSPEEVLRESNVAIGRQLPPGNAKDEDCADAPTALWRKAFMREVPTWTADQIAEQAGYGAKNKSAAAHRWTKDGRIFSVLYGGKQHYPQFQFRHGRPRAVVSRILQALGDECSGWDRAFFFATANSYLADARPMDRLNDKPSEELLVQAARRHAQPADIF